MKQTPITTAITQTEAQATLPIRNERDVQLLKHQVNEQAAAIKMGLLNKTKLITATSELVRNMLKYAGGGQVLVECIRRSQLPGIRLTFSDAGPGIPDINIVMQNGYSTGNTLGLGLPGTKRLVDEFDIRSTVNEGTTVIILKWAHD